MTARNEMHQSPGQPLELSHDRQPAWRTGPNDENEMLKCLWESKKRGGKGEAGRRAGRLGKTDESSWPGEGEGAKMPPPGA